MAYDGNTAKTIHISVTNVQIRISNNGKPIPKAIKQQSFTPFFSDWMDGFYNQLF